MKIKVTEERECCELRDLLLYQGKSQQPTQPPGMLFCRYCGQLWFEKAYTDEAGSRDMRMEIWP